MTDRIDTPPAHLVPTPQARGLARFGVGTAPFNVIAIASLVIMSAWVVLSPRDAIGDTTERFETVQQRRLPAPSPPSTAKSSADPSAPASSDDAIAALGAEPAVITATPAPTPATIAPTRSRPPKRPVIASPPTTATPKAPRCEEFKSQPDAQVWFDAAPAQLAAFDGDSDGQACEELPGRPIPPPPAPTFPVPSADDLIRPTTKIFGVHTPLAPYNMTGVDEITSLAGKAPASVLFFQTLSKAYPADAVSAAWARQMLPMVTLEPIVENSTSGQPRLADIASGKWDAYFAEWGRAAAEQGLPVALRFAQEMNGNWYPWSDGLFGNRPGDFVKAWRHIHDVVTAQGATNVIWVWSVNRVDTLPDPTISRVYPGADYVDWVGMSGYYRNTSSGPPTFDTTFRWTLNALAGVAPGVPVFLTEVGAGTSEANRVGWIGSFFAGLLAHPEVIGFNWFNDYKSGGDWRLQYSTATSQAFAAGVADLRYGPIKPRR